jgi:hypothetical protein
MMRRELCWIMNLMHGRRRGGEGGRAGRGRGIVHKITTETTETITRGTIFHVHTQDPKGRFEMIGTVGTAYMEGETIRKDVMVRAIMGIRNRWARGSRGMVEREVSTREVVRMVIRIVERCAMIRTTEGAERVAGETAQVVVETREVVGTRGRRSTPDNHKVELNTY